jgi:hypothetical protein
MTAPLRILHVPGRTPYARKLRGPRAVLVNETDVAGEVVPRDTSFAWLDRRPDLGFFDVLHVQSLELAEADVIERTLARCVEERKGVVFTLHDVEPLFPDPSRTFDRKVRAACGAAGAVVTLTERARELAAARFGVEASRIEVVPHGPVLPAGHPMWSPQPVRNGRFTLGMFGGLRPNRTFLTPTVNALFGLDEREVRVRILSRGLNPIEVAPDSEGFQLVLLAGRDPRLSLELLPFPTDDEVATFVASLDALVLAYHCGTHSGQLELAMDLGVPVVVPSIGCYADQWRLHADSVPEPYWYECLADDPYSSGGPMLRALRAAHERWRRGSTTRTAAERARFQEVRRMELEGIVRAHEALYARVMPA